ncbi:MAG: hypothetical protein GW760_01385 [Legionella sp.]|jgi:hypothetical protein|nr:hypothetical protein [Legionella sp.]
MNLLEAIQAANFTPPVNIEVGVNIPLSKHSSSNSLTSDDLKINPPLPDQFDAFLPDLQEQDGTPPWINRQDSGTDTDESDETDDVQALARQEEARRSIQAHLDELQTALSVGLDQSTYEKIQEPMNTFFTLATSLALNADRTAEDMSLFKKQVKTEVIPKAEAALLEHESYFSFFCRKIMDALHALLNVLTPVFPSTKNSFFQTAPSRVAEKFEASQQAISTAYGA